MILVSLPTCPGSYSALISGFITSATQTTMSLSALFVMRATRSTWHLEALSSSMSYCRACADPSPAVKTYGSASSTAWPVAVYDAGILRWPCLPPPPPANHFCFLVFICNILYVWHWSIYHVWTESRDVQYFQCFRSSQSCLQHANIHHSYLFVFSFLMIPLISSCVAIWYVIKAAHRVWFCLEMCLCNCKSVTYCILWVTFFKHTTRAMIAGTGAKTQHTST